MVRVERGSEPHVQAAAKDVGVERHVAVGGKPAIEAAIEVAEVDIEILGLHAHVWNDADLEAAAHGPAGGGDAAAGEARHGRVDVAEREPGGEVGQEPVEGIAGTAARGGEPVVAGLAAGGTKGVRGAADAGPVD